MKISRKAGGARAAYTEAKHARGPGGKFAEKPEAVVNKSSSAPQNAVPAAEAARHQSMRDKRIADEARYKGASHPHTSEAANKAHSEWYKNGGVNSGVRHPSNSLSATKEHMKWLVANGKSKYRNPRLKK